jgi:hypothetical protein
MSNLYFKAVNSSTGKLISKREYKSVKDARAAHPDRDKVSLRTYRITSIDGDVVDVIAKKAITKFSNQLRSLIQDTFNTEYDDDGDDDVVNAKIAVGIESAMREFKTNKHAKELAKL